MDRETFERLRAASDKLIDEDIVLRRRRDTAPVLVSDPVPILRHGMIVGTLHVRYNPETDAKTINVSVEGVGPVCRLDVDDRPHGSCGRSHKHELGVETCSAENLKRYVFDRPDLNGRTPEEVFKDFCEMANISSRGVLRLQQ